MIDSTLEKLLSTSSGSSNPSFLIAKAHQQFNIQKYDRAVLYIAKAEQNWDLVNISIRKQLIVQKEMLRAHLLYVDYLESGDLEIKEMSLDQFIKVSRLAKSNKMVKAILIAEAKINAIGS